MNWTGGRLSRHSGRRGGNLVSVQKQHFAKARTNLQNGNRKTSPIKLAFFDRYQAPRASSASRQRGEPLDTPRQSGESRAQDWRPKASTQNRARSRNCSQATEERRRSSLKNETHHAEPSVSVAGDIAFLHEDQARSGRHSPFFLIKAEEDEDGLYDGPSLPGEQHQRSPPNSPLQSFSAPKEPLPFEERKRKLLAETDWVGTSRTHPIQLQFPVAGARRDIGKRRKMNDEDQKRRAEPPRHPYQPLISERLGPESGLIPPHFLADYHRGRDQWDIGDQALSIHIGQQQQTSQTTSLWSGIHTSPTGRVQRSSSEVMLLDEVEDAERALRAQTLLEASRVSYKSRLQAAHTPSVRHNAITTRDSPRYDAIRLFDRTSSESYAGLSPSSGHVAQQNSDPSNLGEKPSSGGDTKASGRIVPCSVAATLGHLQSHGGSHTGARKVTADASSQSTEMSDYGSREVIELPDLPEPSSRSDDAKDAHQQAVPQSRLDSKRLIFRSPPRPGSVKDTKDNGTPELANSQLVSSILADAGTQEDEEAVPAPDDVAWRDWLAIPTASTSNGTINSQGPRTQSRSDTTDHESKPTRIHSEDPIIADRSSPQIRGDEPPHIVAKVHEPTQNQGPLESALSNAQIDVQRTKKPQPVPKPVNQDELWMKFVFGDDYENEENLFNTTIDSRETSPPRHDHEKATINSNSSMIAQASSAPVPNQPKQPKETIQPSSDRAIQAAQFLFSDNDSSSLLSTHLPTKPPLVSNFSSDNKPETHAQPTTPSEHATQASMHVNNSSSITTSPSLQPSSLANASMKNHDPAITSSPDPLQQPPSSSTTPSTKRQKILFTKPTPFVGTRKKGNEAFHIGRNIVSKDSRKVNVRLNNNIAKKSRNPSTRLKDIYDLPSSENRQSPEVEDEEKEESIEDD
ncbi:MAG: hypothetical protein M1812_005994 [Candelaria pacifica]|nr:MAG: hypothetical protein M1812_005994 [Candelaria pacifica]